ncbi:MAG: RelA/SpoT family protein [Patescibacteria group bacterium]|nr:RelA/SpoT family protein [Patescibacteria group bacterium]
MRVFPDLTIGRLIEKAKKYLPGLDEVVIRDAYEFAREAHEGQFRNDEPYLVHPLETTYILLKLRPDMETVSASLLHDVPMHMKNGLFEIEKRFGSKVSSIIRDSMKLRMVRIGGDRAQIEIFRRMFLAMAKDLRVVFIRLADRMHNMMTLEGRDFDFQQMMANETMHVYAKVAARLGIYKFKSQLEDLAFAYLSPEDFNDLKKEVDRYGEMHQEAIDDAVLKLSASLKKEGMEAEVKGRIKHIYSIHSKMKRKDINSLNALYDIYALRIVVPDEDISSLYSALGFIHKNWKPLPNRFKDYVAVPKSNGYRSLHTAVVGLVEGNSQPVEIQIRNKDMDEESRYGVAAHWLYKEKGHKISPANFDQYFEWIEGLSDVDSESNVKLDLFSDRIFALTPDGEVKDLPRGATPIDFAYSVHTDVGHCCFQAKVDGRIVPLDYELKNGQVVTILTKKEPGPNRYWLSFVKTAAASNKIKNHFKSFDKERNVKEGKELLNKYLKMIGKAGLDSRLSLLKVYDGKKLNSVHREEILEALGSGVITVGTVIKKIFLEEDLMGEKKVVDPKKVVSDGSDLTKLMVVGGHTGLPVVLSACCKPGYGDSILGYVTRGKQIRVHKKSCGNLRGLDEDRFVSVDWKSKVSEKSYQAEVKVEAQDRSGLLSDIASVIDDLKCNIANISVDRVDGGVVGMLVIEVGGYDELEKLLNRIEGVVGVEKVSVK